MQPRADGKPVVLLQHGILGSSADWVMLGPNQSLGKDAIDRGCVIGRRYRAAMDAAGRLYRDDGLGGFREIIDWVGGSGEVRIGGQWEVW